jgi:hypothetical protein
MSDDEPQILIVGGNRRGRPPLSRTERSAAINVKMPESDYDAVYKMASEQRVSVPEIMRRAFKCFMDERGGTLRYLK